MKYKSTPEELAVCKKCPAATWCPEYKTVNLLQKLDM